MESDGQQAFGPLGGKKDGKRRGAPAGGLSLLTSGTLPVLGSATASWGDSLLSLHVHMRVCPSLELGVCQDMPSVLQWFLLRDISGWQDWLLGEILGDECCRQSFDHLGWLGVWVRGRNGILFS